MHADIARKALRTLISPSSFEPPSSVFIVVSFRFQRPPVPPNRGRVLPMLPFHGPRLHVPWRSARLRGRALQSTPSGGELLVRRWGVTGDADAEFEQRVMRVDSPPMP